MPRVFTSAFGELEYAESSTLLFPRGLPGFEGCRRFVLVQERAQAPLVHLQSLENPELCFLAAPVHTIVAGYRLKLREEDRLLAPEQDPRLVLALLAPAEGGGWSANLLAPVVIHLPTRIAVQAVRADREYSHEHRLQEVPACL
jgi:flagellar assembly factor FliW